MKKFLSVILVMSMVFSLVVLPSEAEEIEIPLEASRINTENLPAGNIIYMGTASATLTEGDALYSFPIYREGNLSDEVSVDIHTLDLLAVYGKDYEIVDDDVEKTGDGITILEKYATAEDSGEDTADIPFIEVEEEDYTDEEVIENDLEEKTDEDEESEDEGMSLRELKEAQTGLKTRNTEEIEGDISASIQPGVEIQQEILNQMIPEAMQSMDYSSTTTISFAPGEAEKTIRFRILDDDDSEGNEGFSLLLVNPQGAEVYKVTSLSVNIEDDEPIERSEISFSKSKYKSSEGKAIVKIVRKGAEQSLCDFGVVTSGDTAIAGEDYQEFNDTIAFMPYENEKEIEIPVMGNGEFKVFIKDLSGCEEGKYTDAVVKINEKNSEEKIELLSVDSGYQNITIGDTDYRINYEMPDDKNKAASTGVIVDESYIIPPEVGTYYFSTDKSRGGIFSYGKYDGDEPWGCGYRHSDYQMDKNVNDMSYSSHYGRLEWYHTSIWKNGKSYTTSSKIPGAYYQYLTPNWTSTTDKYKGQLARFKAGSHYRDVSGKFDQTLNKGGIRLINESEGSHSAENDDLSLGVYAIDNDSGRTPKNNIKFYGVAAMYKKLSAKITTVNNMEFLTGNNDDKISAKPLQVTINSGAEKKNNATGRDFYLNPDVKKSTLVFSIDSSLVNGKTDKFGVVKGYKITMTPNKKDNSTAVYEYPKEYVEFVKKQEGKKYSSVLNYTTDVVKGILNSVEGEASHLDTIPMDVYFFHWLESKHDKVTLEGSNGYVRGMEIVPIIEYIDSNVEVLPPVAGSGHFINPNLTEGETVTYHAGDTIDLSVVSDDENYRVMGYQVSDDGGKNYNYIQNTSKLFLEPNKNYKVRPYLAKNTNRVEIRFENGAESYLNVQNLIGEEEIAALHDPVVVQELTGENILNLNPDAKDVRDKINPIVGEIYTINITSKEDSEYIYRPVIKHNNNVYSTNSYHFEGAKNTADNIITIGYKKVAKAELNVFDVSGTVVSANDPIKSNGLETKRLPMVGYTVAAGKGTQYTNQSENSKDEFLADGVSGTTTDKGEYLLSGIYGMNGDLITLYISNGITNGYVRTVELTTKGDKNNNAYEVDGGLTEVGYPYGAPRPTSISYTYDKVANNQGNDNDANQIKIVDDNITFSIVVDSGIQKRVIEKAVFTVHKITGDTMEYDAYPIEDGSNVFQCKISSMTENLHGGDSITVHLVDSEKMSLNDGTKIDIVYPELDTGYTMYAAYDLAVVQNFEAKESPTINIPLIGNATGYGQSGILKFNKTEWSGNTGYTVAVNVDATFGGVGTKTVAQKKEMYTQFHKSASKIDEERILASMILSAEFGGKMPNPGKRGPDAYAPYANYREACDAFSNTLKEAKKPFVGYNSEVMSIRVAFVMAFDFVKMPSGDYMFSCGTVALGGTYNFNKTMYTLVSNIPVFLNLQATIQADSVISYTTENGKNAMTAGVFEQIEGNIAERLDGGSWTMSFVISGKAQVGVGLCGVLSARGYASLTFRFDIGVTGEPSGGLITAVGGVGFDLLVISIDFDIVKFTLGYGSLEGKTGGDMFNGLLPMTSSTDGGTSHKYSVGEADMSSFGQNSEIELFSIPDIVSADIILENAAERTRPHIVPLDDENKDKMVVFIGNGTSSGRDEANASTLYYSIYNDEEEHWSTPEPIGPDDTFDTTPEVKKIGNKVYIAWADAGEKISESDTTTAALSKLDISAAIYDISTATMGSKIEVVRETETKCFDALPQINTDGNALFISYLKRDLSNITADESNATEYINSFNKAYSTMAYKEIDLSVNIPYNDGEEIYMRVPNKDLELDDSMVLDLHTVTTNIDGETYMVSTFTLDTDSDMNTSTDREIFLWIIKADNNAENNLMYYPIQITNGDNSESTPKLTKIKTKELNGETVEEKDMIYLTWLSNGYIFNLVEVSDFLNAMFNPVAPKLQKDDGSGEDDEFMLDVDKVKNVYRNGYIVQNGSELTLNENWYKKSADELDITEDVYDDSIFADLASDEFRVHTANFVGNEELQTSIGDYIVTDNGDDIYIYYTGFSEDKENTGKELFGVCYRRKGTATEVLEVDELNSEISGDTTAGKLDDNRIIQPNQWGFGKAVQITNENKVLDEIDLYMTDKNEISMVSNFFEQWIEEDDPVKPMKYGLNKLAYVKFSPVSSLEIVGGGVSLPEKTKPGYCDTLTLGIKNNGLLDAKGYQVQIVVRKGTEGEAGYFSSTLYSHEAKEPIPAGETIFLDIQLNNNVFSNPAVFDGLVIDTTVTEILEYNEDLQGNVTYTLGEPSNTVQQIPYETRLNLFDTNIEQREDGYYFVGKLSNDGFKESSAGVITLTANKDTANERTIAQADTEPLASGEEKIIEFKLDMRIDDFDHLGIINYYISVRAGEDEADAYNSFNTPEPLFAEINDGAEEITLNDDNPTAKITAKAAPWGDYAGEAIYYSEDTSVAIVTNDGDVIPTGNGTANICVYYPKYGINDSISVVSAINSKLTVKVTDSNGYAATAENIMLIDESGTTYSLVAIGGVYTAEIPKGKYDIVITAKIKGKDVKSTTVIEVNDDTEMTIKLPSDSVGSNDFNYEYYDRPGSSGSGGYSSNIINPVAGIEIPAGGINDVFEDVANDEWYSDFVSFVASNGLMIGTEENLFSPNEAITRAMIVTILHRLERQPSVTNIGNEFADAPYDEWYGRAVYWAKYNHIVNGYSNEEFAPDKEISREEMAAIIYRYAKHKGMDVSNARADLSAYTDSGDISEYAIEPMIWVISTGIINGVSDTELDPQGISTRAQAAAVVTRANKVIK